MCGVSGPLARGHVVPACVWRWLKQTSATGYLRTGAQPNRRVEDGWTRWWFCHGCENRISRDERLFREKLFRPIVTGQPTPYPHGPWLARFIAAVAWRVLMLTADRASFEHLTPEQQALVPQAYEHWRAFVHGDAATPGVHELHFMRPGTIGTFHGDRVLPPNINWYLLRTVDVDVVRNPTQAFVYVKMGPAIAFGFLQPPPPDTWVGTRVALDNGQVGGSVTLSLELLDYFIQRAERVRAANERQSATQNDLIAQTMRANPARAAASETFRAIDADVQLFGIDRVYPPTEPITEGTPAEGAAS